MIPYYHFDKFTLGLDVGGIIYEILRNAVLIKQRYRWSIRPDNRTTPDAYTYTVKSRYHNTGLHRSITSFDL